MGAVKMCFDLIVGNSSVFCNCAVGAINSESFTAHVPIITKFDAPPLLNRAFKDDARQVFAILERRIADTSYAIANCNIR